MPDVLRAVMATIVNALASIGVFALCAWVYRVARGREDRPQTDSHVLLHETLTQTIDDGAAKEQEAITEASSSTDAADALADLGNRRRVP